MYFKSSAFNSAMSAFKPMMSLLVAMSASAASLSASASPSAFGLLGREVRLVAQ